MSSAAPLLSSASDRDTPNDSRIVSGAAVRAGGREYTVLYVVDLASVVARALDTGTVERLRVADLTMRPSGPARRRGRTRAPLPEPDGGREEAVVERNVETPPEASTREPEDDPRHAATDDEPFTEVVAPDSGVKDEDSLVPAPRRRGDLATISDEDWKEAERRLAAIKPLLPASARTRAAVIACGCETGVHAATLYRWLATYQAGQRRLSALLPSHSIGGRGKSRLPVEVEAVMADVIERFHLRKERPKVEQTCVEVRSACRTAKVPEPHPATVRRRIAALSAAHAIRRRHGARAARNRFEPLKGEFPGADFPLAVVQVDHTPVDVVLVDEVYRRPIGRPNLTMAIDVYSRIVLGFYVSLDPPGAASVGFCLAHAILPKEAWLAARGIKAEWPCWGVMRTVHVDNAREFHGKMLERACEEYEANLEFRPVARPEFGGHVERAIGTAMGESQRLPGTMKSDAKSRGTYRPNERATMTLREFETWLGVFFTGVYHGRVHSAINTTPLARWTEGLLGGPDRPGIGLPERPADPDRLRLDFMPFVERTVQRYGVLVDSVHYYSDVLRPYVNALDLKAGQVPEARAMRGGAPKRTFIFRRDDRDISALHFLDPETDAYVRVPYRNATHPPISRWELREATCLAREAGRAQVDEVAIFAAYDRMRTIEAASEHSTVKARRAATRRRHHRAATEEMAMPIDVSGPELPETSAGDFDDDYPGGAGGAGRDSAAPAGPAASTGAPNGRRSTLVPTASGSAASPRARAAAAAAPARDDTPPALTRGVLVAADNNDLDDVDDAAALAAFRRGRA